MSRFVRQAHAIVCLHFLLILAGALRAPAQEFRGSLLVTIQDSSGGRIPGADVSLTQDRIGTSRSAKSNARGEVRFDALQPGTYAISADATGFKGTTAAVVVAVGSQPTLGITLAPETIQETVQVHDRGPSLASQPIETTSSTVKTVITSADLDEVPLSARTFANISLLAPFTAPVEPSDPTKARITAVSFGGSSGLNVDLSVDGGEVHVEPRAAAERNGGDARLGICRAYLAVWRGYFA